MLRSRQSPLISFLASCHTCFSLLALIWVLCGTFLPQIEANEYTHTYIISGSSSSPPSSTALPREERGSISALASKIESETEQTLAPPILADYDRLMRKRKKTVSTPKEYIEELRYLSLKYARSYNIGKWKTDKFQSKDEYSTGPTETDAATSSTSFRPQRKYLLFCQAGDRHEIDRWLNQHAVDRNFDIIIGYYGDKDLRADHEVDFWYKHKGYKIPSLEYLHTKLLPGVLCSYDSVFATDADILITTAQLNELFVVRELYDLALLGPTQNPEGKISYPALKPERPFRKLRYTPFMETNTPLFSSDFIRHLIAIRAGRRLYDWGYDFFWNSVVVNEGRHSALADWITVTNPKPVDGHHEIGNEAQQRTNRAMWLRFYSFSQGSSGGQRNFGLHHPSSKDLQATRGYRYIDLDYPSGLPEEITPQTRLIKYKVWNDHFNISAVGDAPGYPYFEIRGN